VLKKLLKRGFRVAGLEVEFRDRLAELIPSNYLRSPYLPRLYTASAGRFLYFKDMLERIKGIEGAVVECGVSVGYGILYFMLLGMLMDRERDVWGFDSFEGFPESTSADAKQIRRASSSAIMRWSVIRWPALPRRATPWCCLNIGIIA
jgi:hypothetical protein